MISVVSQNGAASDSDSDTIDENRTFEIKEVNVLVSAANPPQSIPEFVVHFTVRDSATGKYYFQFDLLSNTAGGGFSIQSKDLKGFTRKVALYGNINSPNIPAGCTLAFTLEVNYEYTDNL